MTLDDTIEPAKVEPFIRRKSELQEEIERMQMEIESLKASRKATEHHIDISELPEEERFKKLATGSKHLVDTIKMVAYRAETAKATILRNNGFRWDEARELLASIYRTEADLIPDYENRTLTVQLHHFATVRADKAVEKLCAELNATETLFPRSDLRLVFKVGSKENP